MNLRELIADNNRKYDMVLSNADYVEWLNNILDRGESFSSYGICSDLGRKKSVSDEDLVHANELIYFYEIVENYYHNNKLDPIISNDKEIYFFKYANNVFSLNLFEDVYGVFIKKFKTKNIKNIPDYYSISEFYENSDKEIKKLKLSFENKTNI